MINILSYYLAWWGIAISAMKNNYLSIVTLLIFFLLIHFLFVVPKDIKTRNDEIMTILMISILGIIIDSFLHYLNFFTLKDNYFIWLLPIWIIFAATLNYSLAFYLKLRNLIVFIVGGLLGPLTYFFASKIALVNYRPSIINFFIHFII